MLVRKFVYSGSLPGVLDSQADDTPVGVQVEVDVLVEFAGLDRRPVGQFDQGGISIGKILDARSLLLRMCSSCGRCASRVSQPHAESLRLLLAEGFQRPYPTSSYA